MLPPFRFICRISMTTVLLCVLWAMLTIRTYAQANAKADAILRTKAEMNAENVSFGHVLQMLHTQHGLNILASGVPLLKNANVQASGTVADALDAVALAFDYQWAMDNRGVILFNKAFRDDRDLPVVSEAELRQMVKETMRIFQSLPFDDNATEQSELRKLAQSLTRPQWEALKSEQTISVRTLLPVQRQWIQAAGILREIGGQKHSWQKLALILEQKDTAQLELSRVERDGFAVRWHMNLYVKDDPQHRYLTLQEFDAPPASAKLSKPARRTGETAFFDERRGRENPAGVPDRWNKPITLSKENLALNALLAEISTSNELEFQATATQKDRILHVYCVNLPRRTLTYAIAELEDWHWYESENHRVEFLPRVLRDTGGVLALPRRFQALMPRDLREYLGTRRPSLSVATFETPFEADRTFQKSAAYQRRENILMSADRQKLAEEILKLVAENVKVPIAKLPASVRKRLMNALLGEAVMEMNDALYFADFWTYVTAPEKARLRLRGRMLDVRIDHNDETGQWAENISVSVPGIAPPDIVPPTP